MSVALRRVGPFFGDAGFRQAVARSRDEAFALRHRVIRPAHLLLGALLTPDARTESVLAKLGIDGTGLAERTMTDLGSPLPSHDGGPDLACTQRGAFVLERASLLAEHLGWGWLGAVHLLVALSEEDWGAAPRLLHAAGATPERLRPAVESIARGMPPDPSVEPMFFWWVPSDARYDSGSGAPAI